MVTFGEDSAEVKSAVLQGTIPHAGATVDCARLAPGAYQLIVGGGPQGRVARFVKD